MHDVAILHDVLFAFQTHFPGFLCAFFAFVLYVVVVGDDFGSNEAAFKVGVDHASSLWGSCAFFNGPVRRR